MTVLAARYRLLEQVGEGGMGVVWHAQDEELERDVAIKLLRPFVAHDAEQERRFRREARTLAALAHENIVRVYDYVATGDESFLVLEYVDGGNLATATRGRLPLPAGEAAGYTQPVARALAYAHAKGVVHRDLTPANILIERDGGRVVTTDFGLARIARSSGSLPLTAAGALLGTPEYWSPEQALGHESDAPADVYALGCILYLLVSGELPFHGDDRLSVGLRRAHEEAPPLRTKLAAAPESLLALVDSMLARDPERRPDAPTVADGLRRLQAARGSEVGATAVVAAPGDTRTIAFPSERPTTQLQEPPATIALARTPTTRTAPSLRRRASRRILAASAATAALIAVALVYGGRLHAPLRVPNVVSLREEAARAAILRRLPAASVSVRRVYSTRVARGHVIRQQPLPRALVRDANVRLVVSKGTPYAAVPELTGGPAAGAKTSLARHGFLSRSLYTPSWTVRKGSVIQQRPGAGTLVRRPATVTLVVASGYPRSVVPDVSGSDVASARARLAADHLGSRLVWRLTDAAPPGHVVKQIPAAGTSVYQGARIRLTIARTLRWQKLFSATGSNAYESGTFTVPGRWRIRYRLSPNEFGFALARFGWARTDEFANGFLASAPDVLRTYVSSDGAGSFRLAVQPYAGTHWYVEVDALR
jgi:eukaryotic-like serine/threonine-protein kinase